MRVISLAALLWFSIWNTHVTNSAGDPVLVIVGPFPNYIECEKVSQIAGPPTEGLTYVGCKSITPEGGV